MGKMARKLAFTVAGTAASRLVRRSTRKMVHSRVGGKLARGTRRNGDLMTGLLWVAGAAAAMALADVCTEQARRAIG
jgi:hypothetical protein